MSIKNSWSKGRIVPFFIIVLFPFILHAEETWKASLYPILDAKNSARIESLGGGGAGLLGGAEMLYVNPAGISSVMHLEPRYQSKLDDREKRTVPNYLTGSIYLNGGTANGTIGKELSDGIFGGSGGFKLGIFSLHGAFGIQQQAIDVPVIDVNPDGEPNPLEKDGNFSDNNLSGGLSAGISTPAGEFRLGAALHTLTTSYGHNGTYAVTGNADATGRSLIYGIQWDVLTRKPSNKIYATIGYSLREDQNKEWYFNKEKKISTEKSSYNQQNIGVLIGIQRLSGDLLDLLISYDLEMTGRTNRFIDYRTGVELRFWPNNEKLLLSLRLGTEMSNTNVSVPSGMEYENFKRIIFGAGGRFKLTNYFALEIEASFLEISDDVYREELYANPWMMNTSLIFFSKTEIQ